MEWREAYVLLPISFGILLLIICTVVRLTGRSIIDDPGALVGMLYTNVGFVFSIMLTGFVQQHLYGFRSCILRTQNRTSFLDDCFDACVTSFLLLLFSWPLLR